MEPHLPRHEPRLVKKFLLISLNLMCVLTGKKEVPFCDVLTKSLSPEQVTPAWCDVCSKYQPTKQSRKISQLPPILALNCGMDSQSVSFITHVLHCSSTNKNNSIRTRTSGKPKWTSWCRKLKRRRKLTKTTLLQQATLLRHHPNHADMETSASVQDADSSTLVDREVSKIKIYFRNSECMQAKKIFSFFFVIFFIGGPLL